MRKPTVNAMILDTLKTPSNRKPKYRVELKRLRYKLSTERSNGCRNSYWCVNGLGLRKDGNTFVLPTRTKNIETISEIKLFDFEHYLATLEQRRKKAERMKAHDSLVSECEQLRPRQRYTRRWENGYYVRLTRKTGRQYYYGNEVISEYKRIKEGIKSLKNRVEWCAEDVSRCKTRLSEAIEDMAERTAMYEAEKDRMSEFLAEHGISA